MKQGLQAAIDKNLIENISTMKLTLENKRVARHQIINPDDDDTLDAEEITQEQTNFLSATSELPLIQQEDETILLSTEPDNQLQELSTILSDGPISEKIADRLMFSNYIISPARSSYNKVFDATTIAFVALYSLLKKTIFNTANKTL